MIRKLYIRLAKNTTLKSIRRYIKHSNAPSILIFQRYRVFEETLLSVVKICST